MFLRIFRIYRHNIYVRGVAAGFFRENVIDGEKIVIGKFGRVYKYVYIVGIQSDTHDRIRIADRFDIRFQKEFALHHADDLYFEGHRFLISLGTGFRALDDGIELQKLFVARRVSFGAIGRKVICRRYVFARIGRSAGKHEVKYCRWFRLRLYLGWKLKGVTAGQQRHMLALSFNPFKRLEAE